MRQCALEFGKVAAVSVLSIGLVTSAIGLAQRPMPARTQWAAHGCFIQ